MEHDSIAPFAIMLTCAAAVAAIIGWQMLTVFIVGVVVTLCAAAFVNVDFD